MTKEELGGSDIHTRAGAIDLAVATEAEAFAAARRFLSYLPQSVYELPARVASQDDVNRRDEKLLSVIPRDRRREIGSASCGASGGQYVSIPGAGGSLKTKNQTEAASRT